MCRLKITIYHQSEYYQNMCFFMYFIYKCGIKEFIILHGYKCIWTYHKTLTPNQAQLQGQSHGRAALFVRSSKLSTGHSKSEKRSWFYFSFCTSAGVWLFICETRNSCNLVFFIRMVASPLFLTGPFISYSLRTWKKPAVNNLSNAS